MEIVNAIRIDFRQRASPDITALKEQCFTATLDKRQDFDRGKKRGWCAHTYPLFSYFIISNMSASRLDSSMGSRPSVVASLTGEPIPTLVESRAQT